MVLPILDPFLSPIPFCTRSGITNITHSIPDRTDHPPSPLLLSWISLPPSLFHYLNIWTSFPSLLPDSAESAKTARSTRSSKSRASRSHEKKEHRELGSDRAGHNKIRKNLRNRQFFYRISVGGKNAVIYPVLTPDLIFLKEFLLAIFDLRNFSLATWRQIKFDGIIETLKIVNFLGHVCGEKILNQGQRIFPEEASRMSINLWDLSREASAICLLAIREQREKASCIQPDGSLKLHRTDLLIPERERTSLCASLYSGVQNEKVTRGRKTHSGKCWWSQEPRRRVTKSLNYASSLKLRPVNARNLHYWLTKKKLFYLHYVFDYFPFVTATGNSSWRLHDTKDETITINSKMGCLNKIFFPSPIGLEVSRVPH